LIPKRGDLNKGRERNSYATNPKTCGKGEEGVRIADGRGEFLFVEDRRRPFRKRAEIDFRRDRGGRNRLERFDSPGGRSTRYESVLEKEKRKIQWGVKKKSRLQLKKRGKPVYCRERHGPPLPVARSG